MITRSGMLFLRMVFYSVLAFVWSSCDYRRHVHCPLVHFTLSHAAVGSRSGRGQAARIGKARVGQEWGKSGADGAFWEAPRSRDRKRPTGAELEEAMGHAGQRVTDQTWPKAGQDGAAVRRPFCSAPCGSCRCKCCNNSATVVAVYGVRRRMVRYN